MSAAETLPPPPLPAGIAALPYETPRYAERPRGLGMLMVVGLLLTVISILPWSMVVLALSGEFRTRSEMTLVITVIFFAVGGAVLGTGLWLVITVARRILRRF